MNYRGPGSWTFVFCQVHLQVHAVDGDAAEADAGGLAEPRAWIKMGLVVVIYSTAIGHRGL